MFVTYLNRMLNFVEYKYEVSYPEEKILKRKFRERNEDPKIYIESEGGFTISKLYI